MSCDAVKRRKGWRMSCDLGEVTERLENELWIAQLVRALARKAKGPGSSPGPG